MNGKLSIMGGLALLVAVGATPLAAQEATWDWSEQLRSGDVLEIRNISGDIDAVAASGGTAEVVATKTGRDSDFDRVDVRVEQDGREFIVCVVYDPRDDDGCDGNGRRGRDRGEARVSVDFELRVPAGVDLVVTTVSGDIDVRNVRSDVRARTVSGDVEVTTTAVARASTVSGDIDVRMGGADWDELAFNSVSGDIVVGLPAGIDADVDIESLSGELESDFGLVLRRRSFVGSSVRGTIGAGGRSLSVNTVSGDVELRSVAN